MKTKYALGLAAAVVLLLAGRAWSQEKSCADLMKETEAVWLTRDYDGSDKILEEAKKVCGETAEYYWRRCRNEYDRIEDLPREKKPGKEALIKHYRNIEALADKCIELDPNLGDCWFWKGVGMGRRGTTQGILNALNEADELEKILLKAESLNPQYRSEDGSANTLGDISNALGMFYRVLPEWLCTVGIKQIVGTCGDLNKSVEYNRKAAAREPGRIEYQKELGISLICRGQKKNNPADIEEGKKILTGLQAMPEFKRTDPIDKKHAQDILADPKLACGYSRDAQQEQSEEKYKGPKE